MTTEEGSLSKTLAIAMAISHEMVAAATKETLRQVAERLRKWKIVELNIDLIEHALSSAMRGTDSALYKRADQAWHQAPTTGNRRALLPGVPFVFHYEYKGITIETVLVFEDAENHRSLMTNDRRPMLLGYVNALKLDRREREGRLDLKFLHKKITLGPGGNCYIEATPFYNAPRLGNFWESTNYELMFDLESLITIENPLGHWVGSVKKYSLPELVSEITQSAQLKKE